jgi:hypothetical protein
MRWADVAVERGAAERHLGRVRRRVSARVVLSFHLRKRHKPLWRSENVCVFRRQYQTPALRIRADFVRKVAHEHHGAIQPPNVPVGLDGPRRYLHGERVLALPLAFVEDFMQVVQALAGHHHGGECARAVAVGADFHDQPHCDSVSGEIAKLPVGEVEGACVERLVLYSYDRGCALRSAGRPPSPL